MKKKKAEDIEDAEIVVSDNKKQDHKNSYWIKYQLIVLYIFVLVLFVTLASLFTYYQRKITSDMPDLQSDINTLSPIVSLKTIEDKLGDLEISVRRENISRIKEASRKIEDSLNQQLDSFTDLKDGKNSLLLMEEDLSKLQLKLERYISEVKTVPNENTENQSFNAAGLADLEKGLGSLEEDFNIKYNILVNRVKKLEQKLLISDNKAFNLNKINLSGIDKSNILDVKSLTQLKEEFPKLAHLALKMEIKKNTNENLWSNFSSTLKSMFVFRSTVPREGSDTDAILSRAEHALSEGNFEGCLNEISYLDSHLAELFVDWKSNLKNLMNENN